MKKLFQSLRQRSCQSVGCFQRQLKITIYDIEFDSILCVIEQYYSLKKQLRNNAKSSSEIDFEVIREQIRENYCKKTWTTCKHDEVRFEFEKIKCFLTIYFLTCKFFTRSF